MKAFEQAVEQILPTVSFAQVDLVGPTVSTEFSTGGLLALSLSLLAMLAYIWIRFGWHFCRQRPADGIGRESDNDYSSADADRVLDE